MIGLFQTVKNGDIEISSKRVVGVVLSGAGLLLLAVLGVYSLFAQAADPGTVQTVGSWLLGIGGGLLGVGVFENLGKR